MIVVEGPDGSGKSTLVWELTQRLGLEQGRRSTTDRDRLHETTVVDSYAAITSEVIDRMAGDPPLIWDRMFYSDPIYAQIVRDEESKFSSPQFNYLHQMIVTLGCPVILCLPPFDTVLENVTSGGHQLDGVAEHIEPIYSAYERMPDLFPNGVIHYDYTLLGTIPRVATKCREYIRNRKELSCRKS